MRTVACLLKSRTVDPDKQPLLVNGSETTFVSRQRPSKHVPEATDTHKTVFSTWSVQRSYKEMHLGKAKHIHKKKPTL
jgi:hypothetical protein